MDKKIEDYLHLYLGCKIQWESLQGTTGASVLTSDNLQQAINFEWKPILRPLSDMKQREADVIWEILDWNERITGYVRVEDLIMEFSPIEDDNGNTSNSHWGGFCKILPYLLSKGFDLFGLIESGIAIDATTLKQTHG